MFSSSLNTGYTTEMLGLLVVIRAVSIPVSKPTVDCYAIDHGFHAISGKVGAKHWVSRHGMRRPVRIPRRQIDDKRRGMRFPVRPKHLPTPGNHALRSIFNLAGPVGVDASQMCAARETRRHPPPGKTVQIRGTSPVTDRGTSPNKESVLRRRSRNGPLNNREKNEIPPPRRQPHN